MHTLSKGARGLLRVSQQSVVDTNEWNAADGGDHDGESRRVLLRTRKEEHDAQECRRTSSVGDQLVGKDWSCRCL